MKRHLFALGVLTVCCAALFAAPVPTVPPDATKDRDGNPLPKGATARLGSRPFYGTGLGGLTFSTDGKQLLSLPDAERVLAWNADTGKALPAVSIKWGDESDGEQIVTSAIAGNRAIWITQPINKAGPDRIDPKAVSTAYAFDLADGREVARVRFTGAVKFDMLPHAVGNVAASADGKYLAVVPEQSRSVEVFDLETGKRLHAQKLAGDAGVYISPDSKTLYVRERQKPLRRFELVGGKELPAVAAAGGSIDLIAASADGKRLVTRERVKRKDEMGKETDGTELTVRDAADKTLGKLELGADAMDFGFAGSGSVVVLTAKFRESLPPVYTLSRWNTTTLEREWEVPGPTLPYKFSLRLLVAPDGKRFAFTDRMNFVHAYDAATGKMVVEPSGHDAWVSWLGFSSDGERITTVGQDGVRVWAPTGERKSAAGVPELARGRIDPTLLGEHLVWVAPSENKKSAELVGWDRAKNAIGWRMPVDGDGPQRVLTHDGKRCVGISWNAPKRVWDVTLYDGPKGTKLQAWTYDKIQNGGGAWWWPMVLSADGNLLFIAGGDGIVGLDASTGAEKLRIDAGKFGADHGPAAFPMAVSGDGKRIAVVAAGGRGHFLRVFEIKTGKELAAHSLGDVYHSALRFSPNGKQVAVWNVWSTAVQVCDAESGTTAIRKLDGVSARPTCVAFSPNGASLAVGYRNGTALVWDLSAK